MNYVIRDIGDLKNEYPQITDQSKFKSLKEYLVIAEKVIRKFGKNYASPAVVKNMLNSEDAISEIAMKLMMGDWRHNAAKGRNEYSYRNQCAIWAIKDYLGLFNTKANRTVYSLDTNVGDEDGCSLSSITEDQLTVQPTQGIVDSERRSKTKKYIKFLMENSNLTEVQKQCLHYRYFYSNYQMVDGEKVLCEGIESYADIGNMFDPPITRQAVKQTIDRTLYKLRQTARGT